MSARTRMLSGFAALGLATFAAQVSGFVILLLLAHRLTPGQIGSYAYAMSVVGYFAIPANFGVTGLAIRDLAQRPGQARELMGEVTSLQVVVGLVPYAALVALAPVLAIDDASRAILPVVGLGFVVEGLSLSWMLYAGARLYVLTAARLVGAVVFGAGTVLFVQQGPHAVTVFGWVTLGGLAATGVATLGVALVAHGPPRPARDVIALRRRFRAGLPLGIAAVMISVYYTIDAVMLGWMRDATTVGQYAVAYKVPLAITTVAALWGSVLFPHASRLAQHDRGRLREDVNLFASLWCIVSLPALVGAALVGHDLMPALFGAEYGPSGTPFALLAVAAAIVLVTINYGTVAIA